MTFLLGTLCYTLRLFNTDPSNKKLYFLLCCTVWIPMNVYILFLINLIFNPGNYIFSGMVDLILVWFCFQLSLLSLMYIMIHTFRYYLNRRGKIINQLNRCSYGVYIIHFVVMGGIALILLHTSIPSLTKYVILIVSTYVAGNLIVSLYNETVQRIWKK